MAQDTKTTVPAQPGGKDFNLQPAQPSAPPTPSSPPAGYPPTSGQVVQAPAPSGSSIGDISTNGAIIGLVVLLVLAVVFFFIRGAIRSHLIHRRASPSSAGSAAWAFFAFLLATSMTVVFGAVGKLWSVMPFIIPMGTLSTVTLLLFIGLYLSASKGRH
jgi:hypothetical protein